VWRSNVREKQAVLPQHRPARAGFRAIGAPSNMPAFAQAFQCKAGDAMVRDGDKQVVIW
jgi:putative endopeptidase